MYEVEVTGDSEWVSAEVLLFTKSVARLYCVQRTPKDAWLARQLAYPQAPRIKRRRGRASVFLIRNRSRYGDLLQPYWLLTVLPRLVLVSCIPPNSM